MTEGSIRAVKLIGLTVCGAAVALAKTAYLPLTLLFLLIPPNRFSSRRRYWLAFAIFMSICLATIVGWSLCTYGAESYSMPGVSPKRQLIYMLNHPIQMVHMEVGMLLAVPFVSDIIGQLGWHQIRLWLPLTALYFGVLFWTTRIGGWPERRMTARQRTILAAAAMACWVAVFSLIYLTFTAVGGRSINGLQGRYMIPATGPFFLIFYPLTPRAARQPRSLHYRLCSRVFGLRSACACAAILYLVVSDEDGRCYRFRCRSGHPDSSAKPHRALG